MTGAAGDRPGRILPLHAAPGPAPAALPSSAAEIPIGAAAVQLADQMVLAVDPGFGVRVRIYAADRKTIRADIVTTAANALQISRLFQRAAERADPALIVAPPASESMP